MNSRPCVHSPKEGSRWWSFLRHFWILGALVLPGVLIGPKVCWYLRESAQVRRLSDEASRLGGWAGVLEGGWSFAREHVSVDLELTGEKIDDGVFARFTAMPAFRHVRNLSLASASVTDKSIPLLRNAPDLNMLDLSRTNVSNDGLETLATITGLNTINLSGTIISDAGLDAYGEKAVGYSVILDVTDTAVTEDGVRRLSARFERWNVVHGTAKAPKYTR